MPKQGQTPRHQCVAWACAHILCCQQHVISTSGIYGAAVCTRHSQHTPSTGVAPCNARAATQGPAPTAGFGGGIQLSHAPKGIQDEATESASFLHWASWGSPCVLWGRMGCYLPK